MKRRTIGQLATELGIGVETVRIYEQRGLIPRAERAGGAYRHHGDDVAAMIRYIRLAQELGLSLKDVDPLKGYLDRGSTFCNVLRDTARNRLDAVT